MTPAWLFVVSFFIGVNNFRVGDSVTGNSKISIIIPLRSGLPMEGHNPMRDERIGPKQRYFACFVMGRRNCTNDIS